MNVKINDEIDFVKEISSHFTRYSKQLNYFNESDAELLFFPNSKNLIAITTDTVSEEIALGIYDNPHTLGWQSIIVNISDLCAVGATPKFILLNQTFSNTYSKEFVAQIQLGIKDACDYYEAYVLGGDTNFSSSPSFGATAIGVYDKSEKSIQRIGCKPYETLYTTDFLGKGNLNAFIKLLHISRDFDFKPKPSIKLSKIISAHASCCIDISDGFFSALDLICKLNDIGVCVQEDIIEFLAPQCIEFSTDFGVSPWVFLAGQLGDYELLFTIPDNKEKDFLKQCKINSFTPKKIGRTIKDKHVWSEALNSSIDTKYIRNLYNTSECNVKLYMENLIEYFNSLKNG